MFLRYAGSNQFALTETADRASAQVLLSREEAVDELRRCGIADPQGALQELALEGGVLKLPEEITTKE